MEQLLIAVMAFSTIFALGLPFVRRRAYAVDKDTELEARKLSIYQDIRDLELDRQMGKVSEQDYADMRADCEQDAARVMKALDEENTRRQKSDVRRCSSCGQSTAREDRFCGSCGHVA